MFKLKLSVFILAGICFQSAHADNDVNTAISQTQDCLQSRNCDSMKTSAGQAANQKALEAVAGNAAQQQELYNISAEIMTLLQQQSGGDPAKMQALMQKAQSNPEAFYNSLSPEIQAKIKNISNHVEQKNPH